MLINGEIMINPKFKRMIIWKKRIEIL